MGVDALALVSTPPKSTSISITSLAGEELSEAVFSTCCPVLSTLGSLLVGEMMGVATFASNLVVRDWVVGDLVVRDWVGGDLVVRDWMGGDLVVRDWEGSTVDLTPTVGVNCFTG